MKNPFKPISVALSPNAFKEDVFLALSLIIFPWNCLKWKRGKAIEKLENKFKDYFKTEYAFSFASGRAGLFTILKSFNLENGDEVITQAYTTVAVPNAIIWAGAKPVYVDIDEDTFNMDAGKLEEKITPKTKAIIVQHTFGLSATIKEILEISKKYNLFVIEDCAHSLGAEYQGKRTGTFGDAAFFSFGRDKIISSVFGGMVVLNNQKIIPRFEKIYQDLLFPSKKWIFQQIFHPIAFAVILPSYYFLKLGQILLFIFQKIVLLSRAYLKIEKNGKMPENFPKKLPNALAKLALVQFEKLEKFNKHRIKIAEFYSKKIKEKNINIKIPRIFKDTKSVFLYYTIQTSQRDKILKIAKKNKIILGNWFSGAVGPQKVNLESVGYKKGDCPVAEKIGKMSLNLPTHYKISIKDAEKIVNFIKKYN